MRPENLFFDGKKWRAPTRRLPPSDSWDRRAEEAFQVGGLLGFGLGALAAMIVWAILPMVI